MDSAHQTPMALDGLTVRQTEVLRLIAAEFLSNREIARRLGISESAVEKHVHSILGSLKVRDRRSAARRYVHISHH